MARQHLDGDGAIETRVAGAIDLAHAAGAKGRNQLVRAKTRAGREAHSMAAILQRGAEPSIG
jgi:hypothetical protein